MPPLHQLAKLYHRQYYRPRALLQRSCYIPRKLRRKPRMPSALALGGPKQGDLQGLGPDRARWRLSRHDQKASRSYSPPTGVLDPALGGALRHPPRAGLGGSPQQTKGRAPECHAPRRAAPMRSRLRRRGRTHHQQRLSTGRQMLWTSPRHDASCESMRICARLQNCVHRLGSGPPWTRDRRRRRRSYRNLNGIRARPSALQQHPSFGPALADGP